MPRAAMSVATSTGVRPERKLSSAFCRWLWLLLPWIAAAWMPAWSSWRATLSAPCLVRVKTIARSMSSVRRTSTSAWRLASRSISRTFCSIRSIGLEAGATAISCGLFRKSSASARIGFGMVADSSTVWRSRGRLARIWRIAGRKPRSSMWSASSSTTVVVWSRRMAPPCMWSIRRPGVATRMSTPRAMLRTCGNGRTPPTTTVAEWRTFWP